MNWKNLLLIFLAALLPALYSGLVAAYPDFPLPQDMFVQVILWIIGLVIGGWTAKIERKNIMRMKLMGTKTPKVMWVWGGIVILMIVLGFVLEFIYPFNLVAAIIIGAFIWYAYVVKL